jgi:hypothetical protein
LEDLGAEVEINTIWETIRENIQISVKEIIGYYELKKHKPWFDERCSKLLDQRGYEPRSNLVKDENGDLLADSNTIVNRWKSYFFQLLNVHDVREVRQIEIHTAEPLAPGPSHLEIEISIAKLKKYKSPGSDQIPAEMYQAGGEILMSVIHKLIASIWNKEELPDLWKESIILPIHKMGDKTVIIIVGYHCYQLHTKFYQISFFHS